MLQQVLAAHLVHALGGGLRLLLLILRFPLQLPDALLRRRPHLLHGSVSASRLLPLNGRKGLVTRRAALPLASHLPHQILVLHLEEAVAVLLVREGLLGCLEFCLRLGELLLDSPHGLHAVQQRLAVLFCAAKELQPLCAPLEQVVAVLQARHDRRRPAVPGPPAAAITAALLAERKQLLLQRPVLVEQLQLLALQGALEPKGLGLVVLEARLELRDDSLLIPHLLRLKAKLTPHLGGLKALVEGLLCEVGALPEGLRHGPRQDLLQGGHRFQLQLRLLQMLLKPLHPAARDIEVPGENIVAGLNVLKLAAPAFGPPGLDSALQAGLQLQQ
mmetsp:Transcript_37587/g.106157  ORF Transcript_37587/g.106157 Transcript_37587/m.106157 type:complete len:331 (-) Transcript_37587:662-1654(-)